MCGGIEAAVTGGGLVIEAGEAPEVEVQSSKAPNAACRLTGTLPSSLSFLFTSLTRKADKQETHPSLLLPFNPF